MSRIIKKKIIDHLLLSLDENTNGSRNLEAKRLIEDIKEKNEKLQKLFKQNSEEFSIKLAQTNKVSKLNKIMHRAVNFEYFDEPLSFEGSLKTNRRFGRKQPSIYLADSPITAIKEIRLDKTFKNTGLFPIKLKLKKVLDLTTKN